MGGEPDRIFARAEKGVAAAKKEREGALERELDEIEYLSGNPAFRSWFKRVIASQGGILMNAIRDEAGQAQGVAMFYIARDLARTDGGQQLVSEIVSEQFGKTKKGNS